MIWAHPLRLRFEAVRSSDITPPLQPRGCNLLGESVSFSSARFRLRELRVGCAVRRLSQAVPPRLQAASEAQNPYL